LIIRALALRELRLRDWWKVWRPRNRRRPVLGAFLAPSASFRIVLLAALRFVDYGPHYLLVAFTCVRGPDRSRGLRQNAPPAACCRSFCASSASTPPPHRRRSVATLVDVTGLCIYFGVALLIPARDVVVAVHFKKLDKNQRQATTGVARNAKLDLDSRTEMSALARKFCMRLVVPESYQLRGMAFDGAPGRVPPRSTTGGARWRAQSS